MELHVLGICFEGNDCFFGQFNGIHVVTLDWLSRLGQSHFHKCLAEWEHLFGAYVEICEFRFSGRRHDKLDDLCNCENRDIVRWNGGVLRKHDVGGCESA